MKNVSIARLSETGSKFQVTAYDERIIDELRRTIAPRRAANDCLFDLTFYRIAQGLKNG